MNQTDADPYELTAEDIPENFQRYINPASSDLEDVLEEINNLTGLENVKKLLTTLAARVRLEKHHADKSGL